MILLKKRPTRLRAAGGPLYSLLLIAPLGRNVPSPGDHLEDGAGAVSMGSTLPMTSRAVSNAGTAALSEGWPGVSVIADRPIVVDHGVDPGALSSTELPPLSTGHSA
ncbi:hypothetical protein [Limoniibacter endophyticus]|uniref:hypothetical protein n=1 Tax=Limoniibacter endophyticus TaxID=1565040 RepID=UPI001672FD2D|nr:hypothetical protein [Limoniibacter endophyticus]